MRLQDIMETSVDVVKATDSADDAWQRMRTQHIRHLVVMGENGVAGVISDRDLGGTRGAALRNGRLVQELMAASVVTARPTTTVREAAT
jgi:CBS domain-containing protein